MGVGRSNEVKASTTFTRGPEYICSSCQTGQNKISAESHFFAGPISHKGLTQFLNVRHDAAPPFHVRSSESIHREDDERRSHKPAPARWRDKKKCPTLITAALNPWNPVHCGMAVPSRTFSRLDLITVILQPGRLSWKFSIRGGTKWEAIA